MANTISEQTREYWLQTVLGWAEDRLPPPQFDECKRALTQAAQTARVEALKEAEGIARCVQSPTAQLIADVIAEQIKAS